MMINFAKRNEMRQIEHFNGLGLADIGHIVW